MEKALEKLEVIKKIVNDQPLTDEEIEIALYFSHEIQATYTPQPETFTIYTSSGGRISPQQVEVLERFTHNNIDLVLHYDFRYTDAYTVSEAITGAAVVQAHKNKIGAISDARHFITNYPDSVDGKIKAIQARKAAQNV